MKSIITVMLLMCSVHSFAQIHLFSEPQNNGESQEVAFGSEELNLNFDQVKSIQLSSGSVVILFERYLNGNPSGRHKLITESSDDILIPFTPVYAIAFENQKNEVIGFEEINFGGASLSFETGENIVPEDFGLSSIYIPKGKTAVLYKEHPQGKSNQEVEHRTMRAGIRPFVGSDMAQKVRIILVR